MAKPSYIFTSEAVTVGHPDKIADAISDAILDACLAQDKASRVACETLVATGMVVLAGEITSKAKVNYADVVRDTVQGIGYVDAAMGFDAHSCAVLVSLDRQSPDISQGVTAGQGLFKEQGAGDQGMMFGYACDETCELMPMPIMFAHRLTRALTKARRTRKLPFLRPDGKSQVTIAYQDGKPAYVDTVVVSAQHAPNISYAKLKKAIITEIIRKEIPSKFLNSKTRYLINPTGRFVVGGPQGDCGLTGRKIIADTYGGMGRHGGGAFSGKDPSKVDRSAAYMARYIAKNLVAAKLARRCEVQLAYAIGFPEPVSIMLQTFGTSSISEERLQRAVRRVFGLKPADIIKHLNLLRPIYSATTACGHFGHLSNWDVYTWEKTDKIKELKAAL